MATGELTVGHLTAACERLGIDVRRLWIGYFAVGGNGSLAAVESWLSGDSDPGDHDYDLMVQALNDEFTERELDHPLPYHSGR